MKISESYKSYRPPADIVPCVRRLLASIPEHHHKSLESIHLTDSASIGRGKTQRVQGKKHVRRQCLGFYHPAYLNGRAWIELTVDQILKDIPPILARRAFVQDALVSSTLFHEIGHHIEYSSKAANRASENKAEERKRQFKKQYMRKHYWWLRPPVLLLRFLFISVTSMWKAANQAVKLTVATVKRVTSRGK